MATSVKVGIVEDDMIIAQGITDALEQLGYETTEPAASYTEALEMLARDKPDILLIDIQLSGRKDGIDLALKLAEDQKLPFIFLTANSDAPTVRRAKEANPSAYLVKPFNKEELFTSIEICMHNFSRSAGKEATGIESHLMNDSIFIKSGQCYNKVLISDILYLESDGVYIQVHTAKGKFLVRSTLQQYLDLISSGKFFRVHRSYAVNLTHVDSITPESLMVAGREIPVSKAMRDELLRAVKVG